jgi:outer membrane lipoprotein-sorting protein
MAGGAVRSGSIPGFRLQEVTTTWPAHAGLGGFAGYRGPVQSVSTWWYASPKRWRVSGRYLIPPRTPVLRGSELDGASFSPVPGTVVSDGRDIWQYDGRFVQVRKILPSDPVTQFWPLDPISPFGQNIHSLQALLAQARQGWTPVLKGSATIAGRAAYVIDLGQNRGLRGSASAHLGSGRNVIWVDKQTFFVLQRRLYAPDDPTKLLTQTTVTAVRYDAIIPPRLLRFVPPRGSIVDDSRPPANKLARPYRQGLAHLARRLPFSLLAPYVRPAGLTWTVPRLISNNTIALAFVPPHRAAGASAQATGLAISERRATAADLARPRPWTRIAAGGAAAWFRVTEHTRELSLVVDGTSIILASRVLDRGAMLALASVFSRVPGGHAPVAVPGVAPLTALRRVLSFPVFVPTWLPAGLAVQRVAEGGTQGGDPPVSAEIDYAGSAGSLSVFENWAGCCIDQDVRKWDMPIPLPDHAMAFSIGGTLWFDRAGTFVALSGSHLTQDQLIRIAGAMSSTASLPLGASVVYGNEVAARTARLNPTGIGPVGFGSRKSRAVVSLSALFGTPTWHGENTGCSRRFTEVEWGDLVAEFRVNTFSGYRYLEGGWLTTSGSPRASRRTVVPRLSTSRRITLGSTLAQVQRAYPRLHAGGTDMWRAGNGLVFMDNAARDPEPASSRIIEIKIGTCGDF